MDDLDRMELTDFIATKVMGYWRGAVDYTQRPEGDVTYYDESNVIVWDYDPTRDLNQASEAAETWCNAHEPAGYSVKRRKWYTEGISDRYEATLSWGVVVGKDARYVEQYASTHATALCMVVKIAEEEVLE